MRSAKAVAFLLALSAGTNTPSTPGHQEWYRGDNHYCKRYQMQHAYTNATAQPNSRMAEAANKPSYEGRGAPISKHKLM